MKGHQVCLAYEGCGISVICLWKILLAAVTDFLFLPFGFVPFPLWGPGHVRMHVWPFVWQNLTNLTENNRVLPSTCALTAIQDSETSCPSLELEVCPWTSASWTCVSWMWPLGEWLNTPCPKLCPTELFFSSKHFTKQNKLREEWSPVVCSSESPGFAGDLYFSFKTSVVIVGLLGFLFSVRAT